MADQPRAEVIDPYSPGATQETIARLAARQAELESLRRAAEEEIQRCCERLVEIGQAIREIERLQ